MKLEPETVESIHLAGRSNSKDTYRCGCVVVGDRAMYLCPYHTGFDDGADAVRQKVANDD